MDNDTDIKVGDTIEFKSTVTDISISAIVLTVDDHPSGPICNFKSTLPDNLGGVMTERVDISLITCVIPLISVMQREKYVERFRMIEME